MTDRPDSADTRHDEAGAGPCGPTWMDQCWEAMTRFISEEVCGHPAKSTGRFGGCPTDTTSRGDE